MTGTDGLQIAGVQHVTDLVDQVGDEGAGFNVV